MANTIYNSFLVNVLNGDIDMDTDTIKVMLTKDYVPDRDAHSFRNDVTGEVVASGYTSGGVALASRTIAQDNTGDLGTFDAADLSIAANITADGAVIYKSVGTAATDPLIAFIDFGSASTGNPFNIAWSALGVLRAAQA